MKALSLRQPFAELIVSGKKTIEIRPWNTNFRGEFLVHAAKKVYKNYCKDNKFETGKIVGKAVLVDVKKYTSIEEFDKDKDKHLADASWFKNPCYGFILTTAEKIDGPEVKGRLNFFNINY